MVVVVNKYVGFAGPVFCFCEYFSVVHGEFEWDMIVGAQVVEVQCLSYYVCIV
jgi:hypothetical protein